MRPIGAKRSPGNPPPSANHTGTPTNKSLTLKKMGMMMTMTTTTATNPRRATRLASSPPPLLSAQKTTAIALAPTPSSIPLATNSRCSHHLERPGCPKTAILKISSKSLGQKMTRMAMRKNLMTMRKMARSKTIANRSVRVVARPSITRRNSVVPM